MNTVPLAVSLHFCSPSTATAISSGKSDRLLKVFRKMDGHFTSEYLCSEQMYSDQATSFRGTMETPFS